MKYPRYQYIPHRVAVVLIIIALHFSSLTKLIELDAATSSGLAPSESVMLAILSGRTVDDITFLSSTRFSSYGETGSWNYQLVSENVGKLVLTYDVVGNNPNIYREEVWLIFNSTTTGTYIYREYEFNTKTFEDSDSFYYPWLADASSRWYDSAIDLGTGWLYFDWFKGFKPMEGADWIYHGRHGWLYVQAEGTSRMFLWDVALGRWMYTNATIYPWMYAYGPDEGWVFFFEGGRPGSRYFKSGGSGQVISETELRVD